MRLPILGELHAEPGYGCTRCGSHYDRDILSGFVHDVRCWGWGTALYNLRLRLVPPAWFP